MDGLRHTTDCIELSSLSGSVLVLSLASLQLQGANPGTAGPHMAALPAALTNDELRIRESGRPSLAREAPKSPPIDYTNVPKTIKRDHIECERERG